MGRTINLIALGLAIVKALASIALSSALSPCPPGAAGFACQQVCAAACNGNADCNLDVCGQPRCVCNANGAIDVLSDKCRCIHGRGGRQCEYLLPTTDCKQGQPFAIPLPFIDHDTCDETTGVLTCQHGAMQYSVSTVSSELQPVTACNLPWVGPVALRVLNIATGTWYWMQRGSAFDLVVNLTQTEENVMWWYFERQTDTSTPLYVIRSAFDQDRTLEIVRSSTTTIELSRTRLAIPTVWSLPALSTLATPISPTFHMLDPSNPSIEATVNFANNQTTVVYAPKLPIRSVWSAQFRDGIVTSVAAGNATAGMGAADVISTTTGMWDPMACLSHCVRDSLCLTAQFQGDSSLAYPYGNCTLYQRASPGFRNQTGGILYQIARPFVFADRFSFTAGTCAIPTDDTIRCRRPRISPANWQDATSSSGLAVVSADLRSNTIGWSVRGSTPGEDGLIPSFTRRWTFEFTDSAANEAIIYPQDDQTLVLGLGALDGQPALVARPLTGQPPSSWLLDYGPIASNGIDTSGLSPASIGPFVLRLAADPRNILQATAGHGRLQLTTNPSAIYRFFLTWDDQDPVLFRNAAITAGGSGFARSLVSSLARCVSTCYYENRRCRAYIYHPLIHLCYLFATPRNTPSIQIQLYPTGDMSYFGYKSRADNIQAEWGLGPFSCDPRAVPVGAIANAVDPTMYARLRYSPNATEYDLPFEGCIPPEIGPIYLAPKFRMDWFLQQSSGSAAFVGEAFDSYDSSFPPDKAGIDFSSAPSVDPLILRPTLDDANVYEIFHATAGWTSLEIERNGLTDALTPRSTKVVFKDVRPQQPARWRLNGFPASSFFTIESFDDPGRYLAVIGDKSIAPALVGATSNVPADSSDTSSFQWTFVHPTWLVVSTQCQGVGLAGDVIYQIQTSVNQLACGTACASFANCDAAVFRLVALQTVCTLMRLIQPGITESATSTGVCMLAGSYAGYSSTTGQLNFPNPLDDSSRAPAPQRANFNTMCMLSGTVMGNFVLDYIAAGAAGPHNGCKRTMSVPSLKLWVLNNPSLCAGTGCADAWTFIDSGTATGSYRICKQGSAGTNDGLLVVPNPCLAFDNTTQTLSLVDLRYTQTDMLSTTFRLSDKFGLLYYNSSLNEPDAVSGEFFVVPLGNVGCCNTGANALGIGEFADFTIQVDIDEGPFLQYTGDPTSTADPLHLTVVYDLDVSNTLLRWVVDMLYFQTIDPTLYTGAPVANDGAGFPAFDWALTVNAVPQLVQDGSIVNVANLDNIGLCMGAALSDLRIHSVVYLPPVPGRIGQCQFLTTVVLDSVTSFQNQETLGPSSSAISGGVVAFHKSGFTLSVAARSADIANAPGQSNTNPYSGGSTIDILRTVSHLYSSIGLEASAWSLGYDGGFADLPTYPIGGCCANNGDTGACTQATETFIWPALVPNLVTIGVNAAKLDEKFEIDGCCCGSDIPQTGNIGRYFKWLQYRPPESISVGDLCPECNVVVNGFYNFDGLTPGEEALGVSNAAGGETAYTPMNLAFSVVPTGVSNKIAFMAAPFNAVRGSNINWGGTNSWFLCVQRMDFSPPTGGPGTPMYILRQLPTNATVYGFDPTCLFTYTVCEAADSVDPALALADGEASGLLPEPHRYCRVRTGANDYKRSSETLAEFDKANNIQSSSSSSSSSASGTQSSTSNLCSSFNIGC